jgi:hypothetical protein
MRCLPFTLIPLLLVACTDQDPVEPDTSPLFAVGAGMKKAPISGLLQSAGGGTPGGVFETPSGICHFWDLPVYTYYEGSLEGPVTFLENIHNKWCDYSHLVCSGPFEGAVTWNGRSGTISGQWTTNCKPDDSQPLGVACDGTMNARGSGGLEGVKFHMKWGPGWYPFPYTGTAFWK